MTLLRDVLIGAGVILLIGGLVSLVVVMVGNWRYRRMKRDQRMSDQWLQRNGRVR